jgi:hypothetical protein
VSARSQAQLTLYSRLVLSTGSKSPPLLSIPKVLLPKTYSRLGNREWKGLPTESICHFCTSGRWFRTDSPPADVCLRRCWRTYGLRRRRVLPLPPYTVCVIDCGGGVDLHQWRGRRRSHTTCSSLARGGHTMRPVYLCVEARPRWRCKQHHPHRAHPHGPYMALYS